MTPGLAKVSRIAWPAVFAALIAYGIWLLHGGYLQYEGAFFLSGFLDGRSLTAKLFSSHVNEWDCYQGRELSFLFGLIDARIIVLSARVNRVALYSATNVVAFFVSAIMLWKTLRRLGPRLSEAQSGLIVSLMLTTPVFALSTYYYRTAKALVGCFLVLLINELGRLIVREVESAREVLSPARPTLIFAFALLMAMSDRLGTAFIVVALFVVVGLTGIRSPRARPAVVALLLALLVNSAFGIIGTKVSTVVDGFAPDTVNEHIPLRYTFADPRHYAAALGLWRDQLGYFLGNWGVVGPALILLLATVAAWQSGTGSDVGSRRVLRGILVFIGAAAALVLLYVAMYAKLTSITWPESRRVYYWIPSMVLIAVTVAIAGSRILSKGPAPSVCLTAVLTAMLCTNVLALSGHREIVVAGEQHIEIAEASRVRDCMRTADTPISFFGLTAGGAQACGSVRLNAFGSSGPGGAPPPATPNALLYCRKTGRR